MSINRIRRSGKISTGKFGLNQTLVIRVLGGGELLAEWKIYIFAKDVATESLKTKTLVCAIFEDSLS